MSLNDSLTRTEKVKAWFRKYIKIPRGVVIALCIFPVFITALYYALRPSRAVMDWAVTYISAPIRNFLGLLSSIYPFAIMEVLCTVAVIFLIYYIIKSIRVTSRRRGKWKLLGNRLLPVLIIALYIWGLFGWLWLSGYHATGFAERYGIHSEGATVEELARLTQHFADRANELGELVERDDDGFYVANRSEMFRNSIYVFDNISDEFPSLGGRLFAPKPMLYSWLMSITGYSGMYFALTGEAMINTQPPGIFMPGTVAHEHAHQRGVFAEDEANFVAIIASIRSDDVVFQYAGYMMGLNYLLGALMFAGSSPGAGPTEQWSQVIDSLSENVVRDRQESSAFWATRTQANTGFDFLDNILTTVAETTSDVVDNIYDGFLRAQNQELGLLSYGACVDLLLVYFREA